jgi:hypothetical protein
VIEAIFILFLYCTEPNGAKNQSLDSSRTDTLQEYRKFSNKADLLDYASKIRLPPDTCILDVQKGQWLDLIFDIRPRDSKTSKATTTDLSRPAPSGDCIIMECIL